MEKRLRTNLFLAGAVIVLASLVWLAPQDSKQEKTFALLEADDSVSEIRVLQSDALQFSLLQQQGAWRVVAPVNLPADTFQVDALLDSLREPARRRYAVEDAELQEIGLADPEWTLVVDGEEIAVGGSAAIGHQRYMMKGGYIYLVSDVLSYRLRRSPWDYLSKRLLPEGELVALALPDGKRIERDGPRWKIIPDETQWTSDALQGLVTAWENAAAIHVTPASSVPRDGEVQLWFADGTTLRFGVELRDTELLLSRDAPEVTYVLPATAAGDLLGRDAE